MRVVNEPIQNSVGQGWVFHGFVPEIKRELAGDDRGALLVAIIEYFKKVLLLACCECSQSPVIKYQHVQPRHLLQDFQIASVAARQRQIFE